MGLWPVFGILATFTTGVRSVLVEGPFSPETTLAVLARYKVTSFGLDMGMFTQNVMILARALGLETCPQQAWCDYGAVVHRELQIPVNHVLISKMAVGYADQDAIENFLITERAPVHEFPIFHET